MRAELSSHLAKTIGVALQLVVATAIGCGDDAGGRDGAVPDAGAVDAAGRSDSGGTDAARPADAGAAGHGTRVFVTSTKYDGNLGGLAGGDARCQARADAEGLGGTWLAWLGDGTDGPATRFVHSDAPYRVVGGGVAAENWADLIDGTIAAPFDHDETGTALPATDDMIVFTAVFHTGGNPTPVNCEAWTTNAATLVPTGLASATDTGWTVFAPHNCDEMHHIYCFEQ